MGADGIYKCRTEPVYVTPHRKPRGGELSAEQKAENDTFGGHRSIVENVFSRVKQFRSMREWRHTCAQHEIMIRFVFQVVQVKNVFRPVRAGDRWDEPGTAASWVEARQKGTAPVVPPPPKRKKRLRRPADGKRSCDGVEPSLHEQFGLDADDLEAQRLMMDQFEEAKRVDARRSLRAERAARYAARGSEPS